MSRDNMVRIQIQAGCPSGRSEHEKIGFWNQSRTVEVHWELVEDFLYNLMQYATEEAQAEHWQWTEEEEWM